jgi:type I restriction enzyme, S subunit
MSFPRYPNYKPSGVEWLGEVPVHWEVRRLKHVCDAFPSSVDKKSVDGQTPVRLCNYTDVYYNDTITNELEFMEATAAAEHVAKFTLRAGDTIITKDSETPDDIAVAAFVPHDLPGIVCGYHLSVIRPKADVQGEFVKRLFDSAYAKSCFAVRANGLTRYGLGQYAVDNLEIPLPPLPEQLAIAAFLDRETAKIDALIAEQRRLIELLQEKRQAVISHAVTKGLDPAAPLKDSGVEWLGEVPAHWEVCSLKRVFRTIDYGISSSLNREGPIAVLRMGNISKGAVVLDDLKYVDSVDPLLLLDHGDLLYNRTNSLDQIGKVGMFIGNGDQVFCFASYLVRMRTRDNTLPEYLSYMLNTDGLIGVARTDAFIAIGQCNLNPNRYCRITAAFPPKSEQIAVVNYLDSITSELEALVDEVQRSVSILQERRSALISAAVTGQIDIRAASERAAS